jgi:hypothetical protein
MAVVRVNYIRNGANVRGRARETLGYIEQRPDKNNEKMQRTLFSWGGELSEEQAFAIIDTAPKGTRFWRIIISPDPQTEDTKKDLNLRQITKDTVSYLEKRFKRDVVFVAAEHAADHTDKKHIHSIVLLRWEERLYVPHLLALIDSATESSLSQRFARDHVSTYLENVQQAKQKYQRNKDVTQQYVGVAGGKARHPRKARQPTIVCATGGVTHIVMKLKSGKQYCVTCKKVQEQSRGLSL